MKIFFLVASLGSGGAERVVSLLSNKLVEQGHDIGIVCLKYNDIYYNLNQDVKVVLAMKQTKNRLTEILWLRKYIKKEKPDVVIPFTEGVYCFTILALLGTGIPIIASERLDPASMSKTRKVLKRLLLPYVDWMVVQTQSIKEYFPKNIQDKTTVIFNPVNDDVFKPSSAIIEKAGKLNRLISVGRLYPQKNQQMLIQAFARVADLFPEWQLVIYGEGPLRAELEDLVSSLCLQDRVLLPGRTENVIEELRKSQIICLSSYYEGMSNTMIEAICVGLPIVTTKVSGTENLINDGENGFLIENNNEVSFAEKIAELMSSSILRKRMSINNQQFVRLFNIDNIINEWIQLINKVINK